jgi:hypothetical protein
MYRNAVYFCSNHCLFPFVVITSFFHFFFCCRWRRSVGVPLHHFAAIMLTVGGVECAFSLTIDQDRIPITLQVIEVELLTDDCSNTPVRVQVTLSDGIHFSSMTLARWLHHLGSELHQGDIVMLTNYISQRVRDDKVVIICLDITVVTASEGIIGNPSEFVSVFQSINQPTVVTTAEDVIAKSFDVSLVFCGMSANSM